MAQALGIGNEICIAYNAYVYCIINRFKRAKPKHFSKQGELLNQSVNSCRLWHVMRWFIAIDLQIF